MSWRSALLFQALTTPFYVLLAFGWANILSVDWRVVLGPAVVVSGFFWLISGLHLRALLRPVDSWRASLAAGETSPLLAVHDLLQRAPTRFTISFSTGWVLNYVLATTYVFFGMVERAPIGQPELESVALLLTGAFAGSASFCFPLVNMLLTRERVAVSNALASTGLVVPPSGVSMARQLSLLMLALAIMALTPVAAVGWSNNTAFTRYRTVSTLVDAGERDARRVVRGLAPEQGEIVDTAALPPLMNSGAIDELPGLGHRVVLDRRRGQASVAIALDGDRWLLNEGPVERGGHGYTIKLLVFCAVLGLSMPLTVVVMVRSTTAPLRDLERSMRRLVEIGDIREFAHVPMIQGDEVGRLTQAFNHLVNNLRLLADTALAVSQGNLEADLDQPGDLHEAFRGMLEKLHEMVVHIRRTAADVAAVSSEIYAATQQQEAAASRNSIEVREVSATVESLAASAGDITLQATSVLDNAERTVATTDSMAAKISELSSHAKGVAELLDLIREIAKRSDLLALNGSLEATRAGEAGRGFAIVAAEMRRLAERVTEAVADGRERVENIERSGSSTVMATEEGRKLASDTATAARQIFSVTRKQGEDTMHAASAVQLITEFTLGASAATTQTRAAAEGLRQQVEELDRLTRQFKLRSDDAPQP